MWAARFNLEFRNEIDNVCGHYPQQLACGGTHLGIQLKNLNMAAMNQSQLSKTVSSLHIRSDRVFFPYTDNVCDERIRQAGLNLLDLCFFYPI